MNGAIETMQSLIKALEAGSYDVAPSSLVQGSSLQREDLSNVMQVLTIDSAKLKLKGKLPTETSKAMLTQFNRQLSYGGMGGSAVLEGQVGQEETSDFLRVTVPMCFYAHQRKVTIQAQMVETFDGVKADERSAKDAAMKLAIDVDFDSFRGMADFSDVGVFNGSPAALPTLPNIRGVDLQIRESDLLNNSRDLMFEEFGGNESVVINGGGTLTQENIEDAWVRSQMNHGEADELILDPITMSNYNKISFGKERIILAGSAQGNTGSDLSKQFVSGGMVKIDKSRVLSGKTTWAQARSNGPTMGTGSVVATSTTTSGVVTSFVLNERYRFRVTAGNEIGESGPVVVVDGGANAYVDVVATGDTLNLVITHGTSTGRFFNVYRSVAGGTTVKFVGRVKRSTGSTTTFYDYNNRAPGAVTGVLLQRDTWGYHEMAPFSRLKTAVVQLAQPEVFFEFETLCGYQPRKNALIANLS